MVAAREVRTECADLLFLKLILLYALVQKGSVIEVLYGFRHNYNSGGFRILMKRGQGRGALLTVVDRRSGQGVPHSAHRLSPFETRRCPSPDDQCMAHVGASAASVYYRPRRAVDQSERR